MSKYIDSEKLLAEIEREIESSSKKIKPGKSDEKSTFCRGEITALYTIKNLITRLQQDKPELDLDYLKNKAELIANGIMIGVQASKYHTCIYDKASNDFNHSHLVRAALKGIEFGLNAEKEE